MCASVSKRDRIGVSTPNGDEQHPWQHAELVDCLAWVAHLARRPTNGRSGGVLHGDIQGVWVRFWVWRVVLNYIDAAPSRGVSGGKYRISIGGPLA